VILTINPQGRTRRATRDLVAHLQKAEDGQIVDLVCIAGTPARTVIEAVRDFERIRDGSEARIAIQHLTVSPGRPWTDLERDEAVDEVLRALGAERHAHVLIAHRNKPRARGDASATHFHLAVAHVGPTLHALDLRCSYLKLEAARSRLEVRFGEPLTPSRRSNAIAKHLRRDGYETVAALVEADAATRSELPRSGLTSRSRARLERDGINAAKTRATVIAAYQGSDTRAAFEAALTQDGLALEAGDCANVWLIRKGDKLIGPLDRLVDTPRLTLMARLVERPDTVRLELDTARAAAEGYEAISRAESPDRTTASDQALQVWMHRLACGLAAAEKALDQALERSPSPPSRTNALNRAQADCRTAEDDYRRAKDDHRRAEDDCCTAHALVENRRPKPLTGWQAWASRVKAPFGRTQAHPDASCLADAERDLERARDCWADAERDLKLTRNRRAGAEAKLKGIEAKIAAEKQDYEHLIAQEDERAKPKQEEAKENIALYRDLRLLLEQEPWRAVQDDATLLSEVYRMRRAQDRNACVWDEADTAGAEPARIHEAPIPRPG
jgi:hypothetical protein